MSDSIALQLNKGLKALIFWSYGWKKRKYRSFGQWLVQWRDPHSGLWYSDSSAMKIIVAEVMRPYNRC